MISLLKRRYGFRPDLPDHRDHRFSVPPRIAFPDKVDLSAHLSDVFDQGQLGSCTGNGISEGLYTRMSLLNRSDLFTPSRLFIYFNERLLEGTILLDSGAQIRDGIKSVNKFGVCSEKEWPYSDDQLHFRLPPGPGQYQAARLHKLVKYQRVDIYRDDIKAALALALPVVIGFSVFESFESPEVAASGVIPMPGPDEKLLGGHCTVLYGYGNHDDQHADSRNSWGKDWGDKGNFHVPWKYLEKFGADFWALDLMT